MTITLDADVGLLVADLQTGTDGELITWDASGNPTTVTTGTAGQVLTSNGAGAAPSFGSIASDVVLLETTTISSAVGSIDFTAFDNATYTSYFVVCSGVAVTTDNDDIYIRTSTNGGSSFDSTSGDYEAQRHSSFASTVNAQAPVATNLLEVDTHNIGNAANEGTSGIIEILNPTDSEWTWFYYDFAIYEGAGRMNTLNGSGVRKSTTAIDAIQIGVISGTMDAGTFKFYGRK